MSYDPVMPATWVCAECHEPAVRVGDTVRCTSPGCGVVRILPDVSGVPWRYEGEDPSV